MTAAVETSNNSSASKFPKSLKWRTKLFNKTKEVEENIEEGAKGGKPAYGTVAPDPKEVETNPIQNVAGTGINVNDAQKTAGNQDVLEEKYLENGKEGTLQTTPPSPRKEGKQRQVQEEDGGAEQASSSGIPSEVRRGSLAPGHNLSVDEESDEGEEEVDKIVFYHRTQPYFWLSNSSDHPVYLDGVRYPTAEHCFQALKFLPHKPEIIAMRTVLLLKFSQNTTLTKQLLRTGDAELIEDSPTDAFWGIAAGGGRQVGAGRNELGKALMRTRESIRNQSGLGFGSGAKTV
ncbi:DUF1768-domain-containing protein [Meira miltonrushii]|uniref:DUF1768-domain-containing protein n=1 Tax=Meira miltonrushii TaxID=1280837 RepID=A0A316VJZ2_9BASI|nr:DUF1768-domain-containing protein [Meira miltonrushii]PWN36623.1 DUF1768-domain-containing protein [Meira miltonrushii]